MTALETGLEACNQKFRENLTISLEKVEQIYNKQQDRDAVEITEAIGNMAKMIYSYAT
jgi:hypothetical protein